MKPKYKIGQAVAILKDNKVMLAEVQQAVGTPQRVYLKQQGFPPKGEPEGPEVKAYSYFIFLTKGEEPILVKEDEITPIGNLSSFLILRRKNDTSSIDETPARALAAQIIDSSEQLTHLEGEPYYECEDALTELINSYKP